MARIFIAIFVFSVFYGNGYAQIAPDVFEAGGDIEVECSKNSAGDIFTNYDATLAMITKITLSRTTSQQPTDKDWQQLAEYWPLSPTSKYKTIDFTNTRYKYTMEGGQEGTGSLSGNGDKISLKLEISRAVCTDSYVYKCKFDYIKNDGSGSEAEMTQNVTATAQLTNFVFDRFRDNFDNKYDENENITFTCRVDGPDSGLQVIMETRNCPTQFSPNPPHQGVFGLKVTENPVSSPVDCSYKTHRYEATYTYIVVKNDICSVRCSVLENGVQQDSRNYSILVNVNEPGPGQTVASAGGGDDMGLILGIVFGLIALIIIVTLVVYFCWFKKRNAADKYTDEEEVNANKSPNESYAPPPVFYTKPHKPEADIRDNASVGSSMDDYKGNARYNNVPHGEEPKEHRPRTQPRSEGRRGRQRSDDYQDEHDDRRNSGQRYDKRPERHERRTPSYDDTQPYASTDVSYSGDEAYTDTQARTAYKPRPKRRSRGTEKYPEEKPLHYAELDLPQRRAETAGRREEETGGRRERGRGGGGRGYDRDPVEYASIQV